MKFGRFWKMFYYEGFFFGQTDIFCSKQYWRFWYNKDVITIRPEENAASKRKRIISPFKTAFEIYNNNKIVFANFEYRLMKTLSGFLEKSSTTLINMLKQKRKAEQEVRQYVIKRKWEALDDSKLAVQLLKAAKPILNQTEINGIKVELKWNV